MKGVQFGTSSANELQADYLHDYFKAVDRGIHPIPARDPQRPILAGVTRELAIYRTVNTYSPALAGAGHGSTETLGRALRQGRGVDGVARRARIRATRGDHQSGGSRHDS